MRRRPAPLLYHRPRRERAGRGRRALGQRRLQVRSDDDQRGDSGEQQCRFQQQTEDLDGLAPVADLVGVAGQPDRTQHDIPDQRYHRDAESQQPPHRRRGQHHRDRGDDGHDGEPDIHHHEVTGMAGGYVATVHRVDGGHHEAEYGGQPPHDVGRRDGPGRIGNAHGYLR